jgi:hypothetical protein
MGHACFSVKINQIKLNINPLTGQSSYILERLDYILDLITTMKLLLV